MEQSSEPNYKYNEGKILAMLTEYINKTYGEHYAAEGIQTVDVWEGLGIAPESCQSNVLKYAMRYGKKGGYNPKDLMKILHYTILWYHYTQLAQSSPVKEESRVRDGMIELTPDEIANIKASVRTGKLEINQKDLENLRLTLGVDK